MTNVRSDHAARTLNHALSRRAAVGRFVGAGAVAALTAAGLGTARTRTSVAAFPRGGLMNQATPDNQATPASQATPAAGGTPTVVLVHGAFADASSWAGVIAELQRDGTAVLAPANPLRSLSGDVAYVASVANQIAGPVLLVGHSYGGAVIANAAPQAANVVGLVFVAAFIPDEGESVLSLAEHATDSLLGPALRPAQYPTGQGQAPGTEFSVDQAAFPEVVAADLPAAQAAVLAVSQRPAADLAFGEPSGPVGWKTLPSWALVSPSDRVIGPSGERLMAERSGAQIVEVDASHLVMVSQPTAVADLIRAALAAVR